MNDSVVENSQLYDYLKDKFGKCEILPSGDYSVNYQGNLFYFSSDCTENNVNLLSYYPGIGGVSADTWEYRNNLVENGVPSNSVIMLAYNDRDSLNTFEVFDSVSSDMGINVSSVQSVCFSGSGDTGFVRLNEYLTQHSDLIDSSSLVVVDGYVLEYNIIGGRYSTDVLKENQVPVYMVTDSSQSFSNRVRGLTTQLSDVGINAYLVEIDEYVGHSGANKVVLKDGFAQYVAGVSNDFNSSVNYKFYKYEDNGFELQDVEKIRGNNYLYVGLSNIEDMFNTETYKIEDVNCEVSDKYSHLKSLGEYSFKNITLSAVSSELQYIQNFANEVVNSIKSDSLFDSTMLDVGGGCGPLANAINECLSLYYEGVGNLLNNISLEADAIVSIGQSFADLDVYLEKEVEEDVATLVTTTNSENSLFDGQVSDTNDVFNDLSNNQNESEIVLVEDKNVQDTKVDNNEKNNVIDNELKQDSSSQSVSNSQNSTDKISSYGSSYSNESTYSVNNSEIVYDKGEYDVVFETNGNDIVSMKYKYEYDTSSEANNIYELLLSKLDDNKDIENVVLNGNVIEIIFKDSVFENMDIDRMLEKNLVEGLM